MKNLLTAVVIVFSTSLFGQTHEIIKHNGEKLDVNFIKIENNLIYYSSINSMLDEKISKYAVAQLNGKSKMYSQIISDKIKPTGKSNYKKVIILKESETLGLKKADTLNSFFGRIKGQSPLALLEMGENHLKKIAALKGIQFIVIVSNTTDNLKAIAYTY